MQTLLLDADVVEAQAPLAAVIDAVESAFGAYARDHVVMPPKSYVDLPAYNGDFRAMPAYVDARADDGTPTAWDAAAIKWVNVHPDNPEQFDLPTVLGTLVYSDPRNAFPLAIMDGTVLTEKRTGAAAAVATKHLAIGDARSMGLVGAGVQSYTQLEAVAQVRPIEEVVVADRNEAKCEAFVEHFADRFDVRRGSIAEAARCDVCSTVTPVEEPIVHEVGARTHVNAIGADAAGKHEIADAILESATIVIDDYEQCTHSGEINVPWAAGVLDDSHIHAELGDVVVGDASGRTDDTGVTVFDSTGLAIQDVAAAHVVYEGAQSAGEGTEFALVGTDTS